MLSAWSPVLPTAVRLLRPGGEGCFCASFDATQNAVEAAPCAAATIFVTGVASLELCFALTLSLFTSPSNVCLAACAVDSDCTTPCPVCSGDDRCHGCATLVPHTTNSPAHCSLTDPATSAALRALWTATAQTRAPHAVAMTSVTEWLWKDEELRWMHKT